MARRFPTRIFHGVFMAAALASFTALAPASHADSIITSSLSVPDGGGSALLFDMGRADAQAFRTDDNRYVLTSIIARVGNQTGTPLPIANLRTDDPSGKTPAIGKTNYLTTFVLPDLTGVISDRTFLPDSTVILEANTRYWFVLGTVSGDSEENPRNFSWAFSSANGPITGPGTVPPQFAETLDEGDSWEVFSDTPFFIEVRGDVIAAVPEPSVLGLFAVAGIPALGLVTRQNAVRDATRKK